MTALASNSYENCLAACVALLLGGCLASSPTQRGVENPLSPVSLPIEEQEGSYKCQADAFSPPMGVARKSSDPPFLKTRYLLHSELANALSALRKTLCFRIMSEYFKVIKEGALCCLLYQC